MCLHDCAIQVPPRLWLWIPSSYSFGLGGGAGSSLCFCGTGSGFCSRASVQDLRSCGMFPRCGMAGLRNSGFCGTPSFGFGFLLLRGFGFPWRGFVGSCGVVLVHGFLWRSTGLFWLARLGSEKSPRVECGSGLASLHLAVPLTPDWAWPKLGSGAIERRVTVQCGCAVRSLAICKYCSSDGKGS